MKSLDQDTKVLFLLVLLMVCGATWVVSSWLIGVELRKHAELVTNDSTQIRKFREECSTREGSWQLVQINDGVHTNLWCIPKKESNDT